MGECTIVIEHQDRPDAFGWFDEQKLKKYDSCRNRLRDKFQNIFSDHGLYCGFLVNPEPAGYTKPSTHPENYYIKKQPRIQATGEERIHQLFAHRPRLRYPRLGSFEVSVRCSVGGLPKEFEVWSKLKSRKWPNPERLAADVVKLFNGEALANERGELLREIQSRFKQQTDAGDTTMNSTINNTSLRGGAVFPPMYYAMRPRGPVGKPTESRRDRSCGEPMQPRLRHPTPPSPPKTRPSSAHSARYRLKDDSASTPSIRLARPSSAPLRHKQKMDFPQGHQYEFLTPSISNDSREDLHDRLSREDSREYFDTTFSPYQQAQPVPAFVPHETTEQSRSEPFEDCPPYSRTAAWQPQAEVELRSTPKNELSSVPALQSRAAVQTELAVSGQELDREREKHPEEVSNYGSEEFEEDPVEATYLEADQKETKNCPVGLAPHDTIKSDKLSDNGSVGSVKETIEPIVSENQKKVEDENLEYDSGFEDDEEAGQRGATVQTIKSNVLEDEPPEQISEPEENPVEDSFAQMKHFLNKPTDGDQESSVSESVEKEVQKSVGSISQPMEVGKKDAQDKVAGNVESSKGVGKDTSAPEQTKIAKQPADTSPEQVSELESEAEEKPKAQDVFSDFEEEDPEDVPPEPASRDARIPLQKPVEHVESRTDVGKSASATEQVKITEAPKDMPPEQASEPDENIVEDDSFARMKQFLTSPREADLDSSLSESVEKDSARTLTRNTAPEDQQSVTPKANENPTKAIDKVENKLPKEQPAQMTSNDEGREEYSEWEGSEDGDERNNGEIKENNLVPSDLQDAEEESVRSEVEECSDLAEPIEVDNHRYDYAEDHESFSGDSEFES